MATFTLKKTEAFSRNFGKVSDLRIGTNLHSQVDVILYYVKQGRSGSKGNVLIECMPTLRLIIKMVASQLAPA